MDLENKEKLEDHLDGAKVEQEMLQAVQKESIDILEVALRTYHINLSVLKSKMHLLKSGRSKIRLMNLLIEYPLNSDKLKAHTDIEKELFILADNCLQAKYLAMMYQMALGGEEIMKAAEEKVKSEMKEQVGEVPVIES
jgi:hypothetical protein